MAALIRVKNMAQLWRLPGCTRKTGAYPRWCSAMSGVAHCCFTLVTWCYVNNMAFGEQPISSSANCWMTTGELAGSETRLRETNGHTSDTIVPRSRFRHREEKPNIAAGRAKGEARFQLQQGKLVLSLRTKSYGPGVGVAGWAISCSSTLLVVRWNRVVGRHNWRMLGW